MDESGTSTVDSVEDNGADTDGADKPGMGTANPAGADKADKPSTSPANPVKADEIDNLI